MNSERKTFEELYDEYWLDIKKFIYVSARRDADAVDDIFQAVWENVFRYLDSLKDPNSARSWLYSIARNEAKRYFEKNGVRMYTEVSLSSDDEESGEMEVEDEGETEFPEAFANAELVKKLLNSLAEDEQQMVLLHYCYGVKLTELADMYDSNYNTMKSLTRRALAKMRAAVE